MLRGIFGMAIFGICLNANALFLDSLSLSGARCRIFIADTATCFRSFEHPCVNYYHFNYNQYPASSSYRNTSLITIDYTPAANCTLFISKFIRTPSNETFAKISCDSLSTLDFDQTYRIDSAATVIEWTYQLPVKRRLLRLDVNSNKIKFVLKSTVDSIGFVFSRSEPYGSAAITGKPTIVPNVDASKNAYTIDGKSTGSIDKLPPVYITRNAVRVNTRHRLFF